MSSQRKKDERKKARELEQQQREKKEATIQTVKRILIAAIAITGIFIFFTNRDYIGYFLAAIAIPYGAFGLFVPYKSARTYAKKGYEAIYSRNFGSLMVSLGVLGIIYSRLMPEIDQNKWFLVLLLVYLVLFFTVLNILQKRYMKPPEKDPDAPTLEEMAQMVREAKKEAKEAKKKEKQQ